MASVLGVGGVFFKSKDRKQLKQWYAKWLNIPFEEGDDGAAFFRPDTMPAAGGTVWSIFDAKTDYFAPSPRDFMFNLAVDNLDEAIAQVREGGAEVIDEIQDYPYGRFGWFMDPDCNKVELWEPK